MDSRPEILVMENKISHIKIIVIFCYIIRNYGYTDKNKKTI